MKNQKTKKTLPPQQLPTQPGKEYQMQTPPDILDKNYKASGKLFDQIAIITGGDSGIGRSVAIHYALEGADCVVVYLNEHEDAKITKQLIEMIGRKCLLISGDVGEKKFCEKVVKETIKTFHKIDILINNAAEQHVQTDFEKISEDQLEKTFRTNMYAFFFLTQAALPHLKKGACIINTTSITAYRGSAHLIDYASTKGAILAFTRSLSQNLVKRGIRVNGVAPGPIWTPLIPSTFSKEKVAKFGADTPMERPGQPKEVAPCYVFLASTDASYITGQVLHPNGGTVING